jgi:hypothetical protein
MRSLMRQSGWIDDVRTSVVYYLWEARGHQDVQT